jgi:hypothetical protein
MGAWEGFHTISDFLSIPVASFSSLGSLLSKDSRCVGVPPIAERI